jgi:hypothetical protein
MKQEDYNQFMRYPWEHSALKVVENKSCPECKEKYLGNGIEKCVVCEPFKQVRG